MYKLALMSKLKDFQSLLDYDYFTSVEKKKSEKNWYYPEFNCITWKSKLPKGFEDISFGLEKILSVAQEYDSLRLMNSIDWSQKIVIIDGYNPSTMMAETVVLCNPVRAVVRSKNLFAISLIPEKEIIDVLFEKETSIGFNQENSRDFFSNKAKFISDVIRADDLDFTKKISGIIDKFKSSSLSVVFDKVDLDLTPVLLEFEAQGKSLDNLIGSVNLLNKGFSIKVKSELLKVGTLIDLHQKCNSKNFLKESDVIARYLDENKFVEAIDFTSARIKTSVEIIKMLGVFINRMSLKSKSFYNSKLFQENKEKYIDLIQKLGRDSYVFLDKTALNNFYSLYFHAGASPVLINTNADNSASLAAGFYSVCQKTLLPSETEGFSEYLSSLTQENYHTFLSELIGMEMSRVECTNESPDHPKSSHNSWEEFLLSKFDGLIKDVKVDWNGWRSYLEDNEFLLTAHAKKAKEHIFKMSELFFKNAIQASTPITFNRF